MDSIQIAILMLFTAYSIGLRVARPVQPLLYPLLGAAASDAVVAHPNRTILLPLRIIGL